MRSGNCGLSNPESAQVCRTFNILLTHFYLATKTHHHITLTLEAIVQDQIPFPWALTVNTDLFQVHKYLGYLKCTLYDSYFIAVTCHSQASIYATVYLVCSVQPHAYLATIIPHFLVLTKFANLKYHHQQKLNYVHSSLQDNKLVLFQINLQSEVLQRHNMPYQAC